MKSGFVVPYATEREFAELARLGEERGWDAVLGWEALYGVEAWVQLGAAAMVTERIRLGTLLTPASRHRPWDLASRVGSVDRISGGRAFMSVGLGRPPPGVDRPSRPTRAAPPAPASSTRASRSTPGCSVTPPPSRMPGRTTAPRANDFLLPPPTPQRPHPPVWVVGAPTPGRWPAALARAGGPLAGSDPGDPRARRSSPRPSRRSLRSSTRCAGSARSRACPGRATTSSSRPTRGARSPPSSRPSPAAWEQAGATWWIESWWDVPQGREGLAEVRRRVDAGPPPLR